MLTDARRLAVATALVLPACLMPASEQGSAALELPAGVRPELVEPARQNLERLGGAIDASSLSTYGSRASAPDAFLRALVADYGSQPALLDHQLEVLANALFVLPSGGPERTPALRTWGALTNEDLVALMANQSELFQHHRADPRGAGGVLPFSVCETRFLVAVSSGWREGNGWARCGRIVDHEAYARAYAEFASSCPTADLEEWYAFVGVSSLSPRWLESGLADRSGAQEQAACRDPAAASPECAGWAQDRFGHRQALNRELALRALFYDASSAQLEDPREAVVLVPDQNGDGIGEWTPLAAARPRPGARVVLPIGTELPLAQSVVGTLTSDAPTSVGRLGAGTSVRVEAGESVLLAQPLERTSDSVAAIAAGREVDLDGVTLVLDGGIPASVDGRARMRLDRPLTIPVAGPVQEIWVEPPGGAAPELRAAIPVPAAAGATRMVLGVIAAGDIESQSQVAPGWTRDLLARPDAGLLAMFPAADGCAGAPTIETCTPLRRLATLLARNQDHYATFAALRSQGSSVWGSGPGYRPATPLVSASTLLQNARLLSYGGDSATSLRLLQVVRVPYLDLLAAAPTGVDTLSLANLRPAPATLTFQDLSAGNPLDLDRVWLDDTSLATDHFEESPVSKLGVIPPRQTEDLLVFDFQASAPTYGDTCR